MLQKIQLQKLESKKEPIAYGGGLVKTKILNGAKLKFGDYFECILPIQVPVDEIKECNQPTILGVDFMIQNKLKLKLSPVYVGDDKTDEDVFHVFADGATIRVGQSRTSSARYYLKDANQMELFLNWLLLNLGKQ